MFLFNKTNYNNNNTNNDYYIYYIVLLVILIYLFKKNKRYKKKVFIFSLKYLLKIKYKTLKRKKMLVKFL